MKKLLISHKTINKIKNKRVLIGVSGGVDSMTLLFCLCNIPNICQKIEVLHVNYDMRGQDNDYEKEIVMKMCKTYKLTLHYVKYDKNFKVNNNFQNDARIYRYDLAQKICQEGDLEMFLTAHNLNDYIETYFIKRLQKRNKTNLTIMESTKYKELTVFRPLLDVSKNQIYDYAHLHKISWNEDYTNQGRKYLRNRIRSKILNLSKTNPNLLTSWKNKISMQQALKTNYSIIEKNVCELKGMNIEELKSRISNTLTSLGVYKRKGFLDEVIKLINNSKRYVSLSLNTNLMMVKDDEIIKVITIIQKKIQKEDLTVSKDLVYFNDKLIQFNFNEPTNVCLRYRNTGDIILKKNGHKKLKSELIDKKIQPWVKDNLLVIESAGNIIYVERILTNSNVILINN